MKRCNSKHMRFKGYADGGKVLAKEYGAGEPTLTKAMAARLGVGDGYGGVSDRLSLSNASRGMGKVMAKRKKVLDEL